MAVGASASDVRRLILLQGMLPVFAAVPAVGLAIALAAIWLPARRATRMDPAAVIRLEA